MKKALLLSFAAVAAFSASADEYVAGQCNALQPGYSLTEEWGDASMVGTNWMDARTGIGVGDKFYIMHHADGNVMVYGKKGFVKNINVGPKCWVSCTVDEAGNVIARTDLLNGGTGWPGTGTAGAYVPSQGSFSIIDSKTDAVVKELVPMTDGAVCRFDALGLVKGNILEGFTGLYTPYCAASTVGCNEFLYDKGEFLAGSLFLTPINEAFKDTEAAKPQTLGVAMQYGEGDYKLAVYNNNYLNVTSSENGLGNGIAAYAFVEDEDGAEMWQHTGKFFITPQHASNNGFAVFTVAGKDYIVYTSGQSGQTICADAVAISEVKFADTPVSDNEADKSVLVARKYPALGENGAALYFAKANFTSFNVVPVENEPNSVYIYVFTAANPMFKLKFTVPAGGAGVNDIEVAEDVNAPVEYFNLQGVRVANPENGLYIKRQGSKTEKVVL